MRPAPTQIRPPLRLVVVAVASVLSLGAVLGACGSSKEADVGADTSVSEAPSGTTASSSTQPATTGSSSTGSTDPCKMLTTEEVNTVLKGADSGKQQLSQCTWTDGEGTAARLAISQPKAGTTLDTSTGKNLPGVGEVAVISTAPGSVKISARANGYQVDFSVDTGTSDIKPNQDNAITLVKTVIANLA